MPKMEVRGRIITTIPQKQYNLPLPLPLLLLRQLPLLLRQLPIKIG